LRGPDDRIARVEVAPRLICHDFVVLRAAVLAGSGVVRLPESAVRSDLTEGKLEQVLPQWRTPLGISHLVFPTRRGLLPAVRAFIDFLAAKVPAAI
jgi:DNA-binding transcriptional LysR family regulator